MSDDVSVIWKSRLDNRYDCFVERIDSNYGQLKVLDLQENKLKLDTEVQLSYGAEFGPDIDDVYDWQDMCVRAIES